VLKLRAAGLNVHLIVLTHQEAAMTGPDEIGRVFP
jgi:hypothetical protein